MPTVEAQREKVLIVKMTLKIVFFLNFVMSSIAGKGFCNSFFVNVLCVPLCYLARLMLCALNCSEQVVTPSDVVHCALPLPSGRPRIRPHDRVDTADSALEWPTNSNARPYLNLYVPPALSRALSSGC